MEIILLILLATWATDFVIRTFVDLYLHMKEKLDEHIKH